MQLSKKQQLVIPSCHIIGASFSSPKINASETVIQLYTPEDPDPAAHETWTFFCSFSLQPGEKYTLGDEYVGYFCDGGIFANIYSIAASAGADRIIANINFVERPYYTPAFNDLDHVLQHYWSCWRDDPLYHNWYIGADNEVWEDTGGGGEPTAPGDDQLPPPPGSILYNFFVQDEAGNTLFDESGRKFAVEPETLGN
jgi:hypothetical protein